MGFASLINFFFPIAFFLLFASLVTIVLAFLLLENARELKLPIQRILGIWFAVFGAGYVSLPLLLLGLTAVGIIKSPSDMTVLSVLFLLAWNTAFAVLSAAGAYFFLFLWSTSMQVTATQLERGLPFGQDVVSRERVDKIVEVTYLYTLTGNRMELKPKTFFVLVYKDRNRLLRYALFRPEDSYAEEKFRWQIKEVGPVASRTIPGLPRLPRISFCPFGTDNGERDPTKRQF